LYEPLIQTTMSSSDRLHKHAVRRVKIGRSGGAMVSHVRGRRLAEELGRLASRLRGLAIEGESFDSRCALAQDIRRETPVMSEPDRSP
jgi:hypothetical protein